VCGLGREFLYAERNKDKNHHPSENAEQPVRPMTPFGNIEVFDHDALFPRLPYHRKSPDALLNLPQRHRAEIRPDLTSGMFALERFSGPNQWTPPKYMAGRRRPFTRSCRRCSRIAAFPDLRSAGRTSSARWSVADECPIRKSKVPSIDLGEIGL
jgi:hypothetical protein